MKAGSRLPGEVVGLAAKDQVIFSICSVGAGIERTWPNPRSVPPLPIPRLPAPPLRAPAPSSAASIISVLVAEHCQPALRDDRFQRLLRWRRSTITADQRGAILDMQVGDGFDGTFATALETSGRRQCLRFPLVVSIYGEFCARRRSWRRSEPACTNGHQPLRIER